MKSLAIVTGSSGLVGGETVRFLIDQGFDVIGLDNDMRKYFFGEQGSTALNESKLKALKGFAHHAIDIRDQAAVNAIFARHGKAIGMVIHAAAQPSHDWAAKEPHTDFTVNALGTMNLLEATRKHCPEAAFSFASTNKVYGDAPNRLPVVACEDRWELDETHPYHKLGIDESMSIDQCKHSLFGVSKAAADLMVQEYGRYFGMNTACFRGGCITGATQSGAELHGFLNYLVRCALTGKAYTIFGYEGRQVRDNIHAHDLVQAFWSFSKNPRPGSVYNMGGGRENSCSVLEAIQSIERISGHKVKYTLSEQARSGDHIWWITDTSAFEAHYPDWHRRYSLEKTLSEMIEAHSADLKAAA